MDLYNLVISAKLSKGEGGDVSVDPLSVTENGVYTASSGHAYSPVTVSVPQSGITPTGTKDISANGVYDVTDFASASVSVPTGVFPSGTKNITSNGIYDVESFKSASVAIPSPSGTSSITSNGIYDITNFASVDVNVSGGGGGGITADEVAMRTISGAISGSASIILQGAFNFFSLLTAVSFPNVTEIGNLAFSACSKLATANFSNATKLGNSVFWDCPALATVNFPNVVGIGGYAFSSCGALTSASFPKLISIGSSAFYNCRALTSVYLLASSVASVGSNAFKWTPIGNSTITGSFGSIYVPASLVSDYKAANDWSVYADRITAYEGE